MLWQTLLLLLLSLFLSPSFVFPSVIFLVDCVQMSQQQQQQQQENIYDLFYLFITGFSLCVCSLSPSHHSLFSLFYEEKSGVSVRVCVRSVFVPTVCKNETSILSSDDNLCEMASFQIRSTEDTGKVRERKRKNAPKFWLYQNSKPGLPLSKCSK